MIDEKKLIEDIKNMVGNTHIISARSNGKTIFADFLKKFIENIIKIIEEQPKVDRWIPISEPFDEDNLGSVLCCNVYKQIMIGYLYKNDESETTGYACENEECIMYDVIAWQPLPKPYEVQDETVL